MNRASIDLSNKRSSMNIPVEEKSATLNEPTDPKKIIILNKFAERMKCKNFTPPATLIDDGHVQTFYSDGKLCGYVLNTDNSAIGYFGNLASNANIYRWAIKPKGEYQTSIATFTGSKLLMRFNVARNNFIKTASDADAAEHINEVLEVTTAPLDGDIKEQIDEQQDDTVVARLAALSDFEYDRNRKQEAKKLRIRVTTLDIAVAKERNLIKDVKIIGPRMLSDAYEIVNSHNISHISTSELISVLCTDPNKSWSVFNSGAQITPKQLAHILKLYGVSPRDIRFNNQILKGYARDNIVAAYSRYISSTISSSHNN